MANIFEELLKKEEKGFTHVNPEGDFVKGDKQEKIVFLEYSRKVKEGEISPIETPFSDFYENENGGYTNVSDIIELLESYISGEEEIEEEEESEE